MLNFKSADNPENSDNDMYITRQNWIEATVEPRNKDKTLMTRLNDHNDNGKVTGG